MFVVLNLNSVSMSYQCNGKNGSTKITLSSNYLSQPENGRIYDCNFYLTEYIKKETQLRVVRLESVLLCIPPYLAPPYLKQEHTSVVHSRGRSMRLTPIWNISVVCSWIRTLP